MATVTVLTADRMLEIEAASIVSIAVVDGHLMITRHDTTVLDAGPVFPAPPPSVTGSRASGAALASLLTTLDTLGLIDNNTTA